MSSFSIIFNKRKGYIRYMYSKTSKALEIVFSGAYNPINPYPALQEYLAEARLLDFQKEETIISQGDPCRYIYILISGRVSVLNCISWDNDNVIDFIEPLDIMGLVEYLNKISAYTAFVVAQSKCYILRIPLSVFETIIRENAYICYQTLVTMGASLKSNMDRAETNQLFHSKDILGHYLFLQAQRKTPYVCPLTRKNLAETLHINLRTLYRHLSDFEEKDYIELRKGKIIIEQKNLEKLSVRYGDVIL